MKSTETPRPDGVYSDLSFDDYLAEPRISAGSLTHIMEGPPKFWAESWMNPDREDQDSEAMLIGRAYHCSRLEPEEFEKRYVRDLVKEDFGPELLTSDLDVCARLKELDQPQKPTGEDMLARALRLQERDPDALIWKIRRTQFEEALDGRETIPPKHWRAIERGREWLRANAELTDLLSHGLAEVSILWTDERTGLKCKCRPDWFAFNRFVHLKTWDMKGAGKPGNRAVAGAFEFNGYYRTGWFYQMASEWVRTNNTVKAHGSTRLADLVSSIRLERSLPLDTWFLFIRRGGVPDLRARKIKWFGLPPGVEAQSIGADTAGFRHTLTGLGRRAHDEVNACLDAIVEAQELYGTDTWFPRDILGTLEDDDFSEYFLDSRPLPR